MLGIVAALYAMIGFAAVERLRRPLYRAVLDVLRPAESAVRRHIGLWRGGREPATSLHLLAKPNLDQRLIGHVTLVGGDLDLVEKAHGQAQ